MKPSLRPWWISIVALLTWTACNDSSSPPPPPPAGDQTAPAVILDLRLEETVPGAITLAWTAPGDDGADGTASAYALRQAADSLTAATWDSATVVPSSRVPLAPGTEERWTVTDLPPGPRYFVLRAADEVPNWSGLSTVVRAVVPPIIPDLQVTDLAAGSAGPTSVSLSWTAPGSASTIPQARDYDLRYAQFNISSENWNAAIAVSGVPDPAAFGTRESFTVTSLVTGVTYFFAIRAADATGHWSEVSNVVSEATTTPVSLTRLTTSAAFPGASSADWSPDGQWIAVSAAWPSLPEQIYLMPAAGGDPVQLTDDSNGAGRAAWSPDGTRLAFVRPGRQEVVVMNAEAGAAGTTIAAHPDKQIGKPSWSPDGSHLVYDVHDTNAYTNSEIYVVAIAGGTPNRLAGKELGWSDPDWSPDGSRIAIGSLKAPFVINVVPATGGEAVPVSEPYLLAGRPVWSPGGGRIAFVSGLGGNGNIWVMDSSGHNAIQLTSSPAAEIEPSWAPSGDELSLVRMGDNHALDVWILRF